MAKRRISKAEKRSQAKRAKQQEEALLSFLRNYGDPEPAQNVDAATFDNQIKSITTLLATYINNDPKGTILDLGCGNGVLLSRLTDLSVFTQNIDWSYLGVDFPEYRESVFKLALDHKIHRKVDFVDLDNFYKEWPITQSLARPYIVFIRNVIHELNIPDTARLFEHISKNLTQGEILIIQDLQVFPVAEKGNACWIPEELKKLIEQFGFSALKAIEQSKTGNRWYNIVAVRNAEPPLAQAEIQQAVTESRYEQWAQWRTLGAVHPDDEKFRDVRIAKIDFDLQFAALNNQLLLAGAAGVDPLSRDQQALVVKETFTRALTSFVLLKPADTREVVEGAQHFVDRGNSQNSLEKYLASEYPFTSIIGPTLMGKTELVKHVLSKFQHGRIPALIDVQATASVWNILESLLSSTGCHVPNEILAGMQKISFKDIRPNIADFFQEHAQNLVIVIDHVERLLNPIGQVTDADIQELILILVRSHGAKVILTSRRPINTPFIPAVLQYPESQPPVGRFPEGPPHVEQLLGTFIGLKDFPPALIEGVGRHPLLAVLAGLYLRNKGKEAVENEQFLKELRNNMRVALFSRIVDDESRPAIIAISRLRIPVPRSMIVALSSVGSVQAAEALGLVFFQRDLNREDLLSCVGALRLRTWQGANFGFDDPIDSETDQEVTQDSAEKSAQELVAALYEQLYRKDGDPKWLRESLYHHMLTGDISTLNQFGVSFRSEIFGAGEYWFRYKKDFSSALWAYQSAQHFGDSSVLARMRVASCLLRVKRQQEGEEEFNKLLQEFPEALGVKSSYIDGLLYIREYQRALNLLNEFSLSLKDGVWVAGQFGRAYMGLQRHGEAVEAFKQQLQFEEDALTFQDLARAYHKMGNTQQEQRVLERGLKLFPHSKRLELSYAALLERVGKVVEAAKRLESLFESHPTNGWIIFPLIKTLGRLGEVERAEEIWKNVEDKLHPEILRIPIQATLAVEQGKYDEALSILRRRDDDEHSVGQKLEIYYEWATNSNDEDEKKRIALQGIKEFAGVISANLGHNVPLLISYAKLTILVGNKALYDEIDQKVLDINPNITELDKIKAELKPSWNHDDGTIE